MPEVETPVPPIQTEAPVPLLSDRSFWGLNLTQFFGAFNDNLFKQLVLLSCVGNGKDVQGLATILFAWPFIAFSGFAGFLSDRFSKRTIIVICKAAEFVIVVLGLIGYTTGNLSALLTVLTLMGVHSAFFGPSKFGILPEILRPADLPRANGMMLMATFLAIIFGMAAAGAVKQVFENMLWVASLPCLVIALTGLCTSLLIRPTAVAIPGLKFSWSSVAISADTCKALFNNRTLLGALTMSSVFWFVGGTVYPQTINSFGKEQLRFNDLSTGLMAASTGLGIAVGCLLAGILCKDRIRGWLVTIGAWGLTGSLTLLSLPGPGLNPVRDELHRYALASRQTDSASQKSSMTHTVPDTTNVLNSPPAGDWPNIIGQCLATRISLDTENVPLTDVLNDLSDQFGIEIVADSTGIGIDSSTKVTVHLKQTSLKRVLDMLYEGHAIRIGADEGVLLIGSASRPPKNSDQTMSAYQVAEFHRGSLLGPYGSFVALIAVGFFAGFFSVPLQVYLLSAAPAGQKGRIIGAFNLVNWIGISGSGIVYGLGQRAFVSYLELPHATMFALAAALLLPVALFYRLPEYRLESNP